MFQLMNGCIECAECRNEILYTDEFNCSYCGASLCDNCLLSHEDECSHALDRIAGGYWARPEIGVVKSEFS
jgi:hypothetical protein